MDLATRFMEALAVAALQLLAFSMALLLGLFTIRQEQIAIRRGTLRRILVLQTLLALTGLTWLGYGVGALWLRIPEQELWNLAAIGASVEIVLTASYLTLLLYILWELFGYMRRFEES